MQDTLQVTCPGLSTAAARSLLIVYNPNLEDLDGLLIRNLPWDKNFKAQYLAAGEGVKLPNAKEIYSEAFCTRDDKADEEKPCSLFLDVKLPAITLNFILLETDDSAESK